MILWTLWLLNLGLLLNLRDAFHYQWLGLFALLEKIGIKPSVAFFKVFQYIKFAQRWNVNKLVVSAQNYSDNYWISLFFIHLEYIKQIETAKNRVPLNIHVSVDALWTLQMFYIGIATTIQYMGGVKRIWYLSPMRAAKVQASLRIRAVSPEPPLLAHTSSESRGTFRQKARSLAPLNGWACAVKICHDGMLEDKFAWRGPYIFKEFWN